MNTEIFFHSEVVGIGVGISVHFYCGPLQSWLLKGNSQAS
jgi:hypothetical protein